MTKSLIQVDDFINKIKNSTVENTPWPYFSVNNMLDGSTSTTIHNKLKEGIEWKPDSEASRFGSGNDNIWLSSSVSEEIRSIFRSLTTHNFLSEVFKKFNIDLPEKFHSSWSFAWHKKGARQFPHTDLHVIEHSSEKHGTEYNQMLTQQIYFPNVEYGVKYCEDSGMWLLNDRENDPDYEWIKAKQIKCNPGTYFCYPNSKETFHEVPIQAEEFDRISAISRTMWNKRK